MKIGLIVIGIVSVLGFLRFVFVKWSKKKSEKNQDLLDGDATDIVYELAEAGLDVAVEAIPAIIETSGEAAVVGLKVAGEVAVVGLEVVGEVISSIDV